MLKSWGELPGKLPQKKKIFENNREKSASGRGQM